ncbi:MAG: PTS transporter subunit IIC [Streptococcaceae bacterium]|jgi:PTS system ascorbate-specific IIC component|nr:PTS transporter subunit IIC [Streptococcaceae bacterium]
MALAFMNQFRNTAVILGLIAMIGLMLQKKTGKDVFAGTMKTMIGFMIFNIGSSFLGTIVTNFTTLFNTAFKIQGVTTQVEIATALALNKYGAEIAMILVLGFIMNLVFARITRFKAIFLTGQHFLYFAAVLGLVFIAAKTPMWLTIVASGIILGFAGAAFPSFAQKYMDELTGGEQIAMGHFNALGYWLSGFIGQLVGGKNWQEKKAESEKKTVNMPGFFSLFRDFVFSVALFMIVLFYIVTFAAVATGHMDAVTKMAGADLWFVFPLIQGLQFAAGMSVLIYGVRQFIAEITAAFVAISEKYIPGSKPAIDCPAIFPYAPNAVILGFVGSFAGGLAGMLGMVLFKSSVIMIPAAGICFFSGGTAGVFGSVRGGWKGALLGSFVVGIGLVVLPMFLYPSFAELGIKGASFPNIDYNVLGGVIAAVIRFFQSLF